MATLRNPDFILRTMERGSEGPSVEMVSERLS
jgi:hypothetical protein